MLINVKLKRNKLSFKYSLTCSCNKTRIILVENIELARGVKPLAASGNGPSSAKPQRSPYTCEECAPPRLITYVILIYIIFERRRTRFRYRKWD